MMLVRYRFNRRLAFYDPNWLTSGEKTTVERPVGPFESCAGCPYGTHGFLCYTAEGDCLRTDMQKINRKKKENNHG